MQNGTRQSVEKDSPSVAEAALMAGHSNQKVTEKYTHLTAKRLKEKMDRLGH